MIQKVKYYCLLWTLFFPVFKSTATIPRPDHIVICIMENHSYTQVMDSAIAPYIWSLANSGANLRQFYALTHPSQPNYLLLFSGYNQGEVTDNLPPLTPWQTPNLGASLLQNGYTFKGYSEDLPAVGSTAFYSGSYARKHSPWVNWQGTGINQIPDTLNVPFSFFPTDYTLLPDVSFVIPNQDNDMHNGVDPDRITRGDNWLRDSLGAYITWAQTHNSLFILTFDEDNDAYQNHIACIFNGPMIQPGHYTLNYYNLFDLLRTLEEIYGLPRHGHSRSAIPIQEIWVTSGINTLPVSKAEINPNPFQQNTVITFKNNGSSGNGAFILSDESGKEVFREKIFIQSGSNVYSYRRDKLPDGIYFFSFESDNIQISVGKLIIQ